MGTRLSAALRAAVKQMEVRSIRHGLTLLLAGALACATLQLIDVTLEDSDLLGERDRGSAQLLSSVPTSSEDPSARGRRNDARFASRAPLAMASSAVATPERGEGAAEKSGTLCASVVLRGRVVRAEDGTPVAEIALRGCDEQEQRTDVEGWFHDLSVLRDTRHALLIPGGTDRAREWIAIPTPETDRRDLVIAARAGASLEGRLRDASGAGLAGARVERIERSDRSTRIVDMTCTDLSGAFSFAAVPIDSDLTLRVLLRDGSERRFHARSSAVPGAKTQVVLTFVDGARAEGRVLDANSQPIAGARVRARLGDAATCDAEGRFHLRALAPHSPYLLARAPGCALAAVRADPVSGTIEIAMTRERRLRGILFGMDQLPESDAILHLDVDFDVADLPIARTDAQGRFELGELPLGACHLRVRSRGGRAWRWALPAEIEEAEIRCAPMPTLRGRVIHATTREPVQRFTLSCRTRSSQLSESNSRHPDAEREIAELAVVDASGRFAWPAPCEGPLVEIAVRASGYAEHRVPWVLASSEVQGEVEIALGAPMSLCGRVRAAESSSAIPNAEIFALAWSSGACTSAPELWSSSRHRARAKADGRFVIEGLPSAPQRLLVTAPERGAIVVEGALPGGAELDIALPAAASLRLRSVALRPTGNARLLGPDGLSRVPCESSSEGWLWTELGPGTHRVMIEDVQRFPLWSRVLDLQVGEQRVLDLDEVAGAYLVVEVSRDGVPVSGQRVWLRESDGSTRSIVSDARGLVPFTGVACGEIALRAMESPDWTITSVSGSEAKIALDLGHYAIRGVLHGEDGQPLAAVQITIERLAPPIPWIANATADQEMATLDRATVVGTAVTASDGSFARDGLAIGSYLVSAHAASGKLRRRVELDESRPSAWVELELRGDRAWELSFVEAESGAAIAEGEIALLDAGGKIVMAPREFRNGKAKLRGVPDGELRIAARAPGREPSEQVIAAGAGGALVLTMQPAQRRLVIEFAGGNDYEVRHTEVEASRLDGESLAPGWFGSRRMLCVPLQRCSENGASFAVFDGVPAELMNLRLRLVPREAALRHGAPALEREIWVEVKPQGETRAFVDTRSEG